MKSLSKFVFFMAALSWGSSASAYLLGGIDVGDADPLLGEIENLNNNPTGCGNGNSTTTELCWMNSVLAGLGEGPTTYNANEKVKKQKYSYVDGSSTVIAFELSRSSEYFFIKNSRGYGIFENTSELNWAVIDITSLMDAFKLKPGANKHGDFPTISHIAPIGGSVTVDVPEPGTLALLGLGLAGLGFKRRLFKS